MGLFSSIVGKATSIAKDIGKAATKELDIIQAVYANPTTAITKGIGAAVEKTKSLTPTQAAVKVATNTALAAGTIVGASSTVGKTAISAVGKALLPTTFKKAAIEAAAVPVVYGAIAKSPTNAAKAVVQTPANLAQVGGNIAGLLADPSLENAKNIVKENPVTTGVLVGAAGLGTGIALAPTIASIANTKALNKTTEALIDQPETVQPEVIRSANPGTLTPVVAKETFADQSKTIETTSPASQLPVTPQTQTVAAGGTSTSKKRKPRRRKPQRQNISQKVNVVVANQNYLKRRY